MSTELITKFRSVQVGSAALVEEMLSLNNTAPGDENVRLLPLPNLLQRDSVVIVAAWLYFLLFIIGFSGNVSVLSAIVQMKQFLKEAKETIFFFIVWLCLVDISVLMALPMAITKMLFGHWIFGTALCKVYWIFESTGKIMSAFILTALSFERFVAICYPHNRFFRSRIFLAILFFGISLLTGILIAPLPMEANAQVLKSRVFSIDGHLTIFYREDCSTFTAMSSLDNHKHCVFTCFTCTIFVVAYCIPLICLTFFYGRIMHHLCSHVHRSTTIQSMIPLRKITFYIAGLLVFHFLAWTPYWVMMLNYVFLLANTSDNYVIVMYFVHALPFVNSSFNWIFYAFFNRQFRESYTNVGTVLIERHTTWNNQPGATTAMSPTALVDRITNPAAPAHRELPYPARANSVCVQTNKLVNRTRHENGSVTEETSMEKDRNTPTICGLGVPKNERRSRTIEKSFSEYLPKVVCTELRSSRQSLEAIATVTHESHGTSRRETMITFKFRDTSNYEHV